VFEEVTKREGGKNAARRAGFIFGSTLFQAALVAAIVAASAYVKAKVIDEPKVEVKFVKAAPAPRPPPPPAAPPPKRPKSDKPRTDLPKPPPPQALIQPQDVQAEMKTPDPNEKEPDYDWGDDSAGGEGVVGGVVGGGGGVEDAPSYATAGFKKPVMAQKNCVQEAVRIPRDLQGFISGPITVKFAIGRDSSPSRFEVITTGVPDRITSAIWQAVQECKWIAGADAQGRPTAIWVILPLRFTGG
jgi:protein TonB